MPLLDSDECEKMYHIRGTSLSGKPVIQSDMLCAGFVEGQKDSCQVTTALWVSPAPLSCSLYSHPGGSKRAGVLSQLCGLGRECFTFFFFLDWALFLLP